MSSTLQLQTDPKIENVRMHIAYEALPVVQPDGDVSGDWDERKSNREGYVAFMHVERRRVFVLVRCDGYQDIAVDGEDHRGIAMPHDALITVPMVELEPLPLPPLTVNAFDFQENGRRSVIEEVANFMQFYRVAVLQDDPAPTLYPGFTMDRTTLTMKWIPEQLGLKPLNLSTDDLQKRLVEYLDWKRRIRRRSELTVLCDMRDMGIARQQYVRILQAVYDVAQDYRDICIVEDGNEVLDGENLLDLGYIMAHVDRHGVVYSTGSGTSGSPVPEPYGVYCTPHLNRGPLSKMLADVNMGEQVYGSWAEHPIPTMRPMLTNETKGAGEFDSDSRYTDPNVARELARGMRARNGGCFHCTSGVFSQPLGPKQEACRVAFVEG